MILNMIEYCELINEESMNTKVIQVNTAVDYFSFLSVIEDTEEKFEKDINKLKEIIEDSFWAAPEEPFV